MKKRIRNTILKTYALILLFIWTASVCTLDVNFGRAIIVMAISSVLLFAFLYANRNYRGWE